MHCCIIKFHKTIDHLDLISLLWLSRFATRDRAVFDCSSSDLSASIIFLRQRAESKFHFHWVYYFLFSKSIFGLPVEFVTLKDATDQICSRFRSMVGSGPLSYKSLHQPPIVGKTTGRRTEVSEFPNQITASCSKVALTRTVSPSLTTSTTTEYIG